MLKMNRKSGFTLVEIVTSLLLVGFMSVFAGSVIVTFTKGYLFTKENAHAAQKAQLAVSRINRELKELLNVTNASNTAITIEGTASIHTIGLNDGKIKIAESGTPLADGDILIDDVSDLTFSYYMGSQSWAQGMDIKLLSAIRVAMTLSRSDGGSIDFTTTVHPRNTNNYGGAPPASEPLTKFDYCFLATAAFGDSDHPMVEVLRKFRDRFLVTWKGGQSLVNAYYSVGPTFSKYIEDHNWLAPLVRFMLLPLVGFAALMLKNPLSVPLILLICWLTTRLISELVWLSNLKTLARLSGNKGSVLIGLIITMVTISALGAAMLPLTSTSKFGQVRSNSAARAYFLAESGLRYAASEYLNEDSESAKNDRLLAMHDQTFTMQDDAGTFKLVIYPYYFTTTSNPSGTQTLETVVPGAFPPDLVLSSGKLRIGSQVYDYTDAARIDRNVTFTMSQTMPYVPIDTEIFYVATSADTEVAKGGNLTVQAGTAYAFPQRNGTFVVDKVICSYKENDLDNDQLTEIDFPNDPDLTSLTGISGADIVLQKFVELNSTGTFGLGDEAVSRENVYHVPLPTVLEETVTLEERFDDRSNWEEAKVGLNDIGAHEIKTIGGDAALKVTGTSSFAGSEKASLIALKWSATDVDLAAAHMYGNKFFLSYDAQVKVGFDDSTTPVYGFDPQPIPKYYVAGLSFRLDDDNNSYGLSFLRGDNSIVSPDDNINDNIVPVDDKSLIVLWQQTNSGTDVEWLAYKEMEDRVFFTDDMESGPDKWPLSGTGWNLTTDNSNSPNTSWKFGPAGVFQIIQGEIVSESINLCGASSAELSFLIWRSNKSGHSRIRRIYIIKNGVWNLLDDLSTHAGFLEKKTYDLSSYLGETIEVLFYGWTFRFCISCANEVWFIDDVTVEGELDFFLNESTLLVRVKEAASISFQNGGPDEIIDCEINDCEINDGEIVVGHSSGAIGTVNGEPILDESSGSWAAGSAQGTLILENVNGTFEDSETIYVVGSFAQATVQEYRERDNFIKAYYGDTGGCGTPDGYLLDEQRDANPRDGDIHWPPAEVGGWSANDDHFTLIQWDEIKGGESEDTIKRISSLNEPDAILRSKTLTTPESGTFTQSEIGLHTFGHGSTNVYFDDFALQTDIVTIGAIAPVQE